jgi:hypothetical protein
MYAIKNKTVAATSATASSGNCTRPMAIGGWTNNGTMTNRLACQVEYIYGADDYDGFDLTSFYDAMEALLTGW